MGYLIPMGAIHQCIKEKQYLSQRLKGESEFLKISPELLYRLEIYQDKLTLLYFVSKRVMEAYSALQAAWLYPSKEYPSPENQDHFASQFQRLRYEISFFFVVLKICYDALSNIVLEFLRTNRKDLKGQIPNIKNSFYGLLKWFKKPNINKRLSIFSKIVTDREDKFLEVRGIRDEFIHGTKETLVFNVIEHKELAFKICSRKVPSMIPLNVWKVDDVVPIIPYLRKHIKAHYELAFELESEILKIETQSGPKKFPGSYFCIDPKVIDIYTPEGITTFGIENYILG